MKNVVKKLRDVLRALVEPINSALIMILGIYTTMWGLWLASPFWDVFTSARLYSKMDQLAPEWVWGVIAIGVGISVLLYANHKDTFRRGAAIGYIFWLINSTMYAMGDLTNTGAITSATFSMLYALVYLSARFESNRQKNGS